jgi:CTLH/CRA C-terminal to LisH motif domain
LFCYFSLPLFHSFIFINNSNVFILWKKYIKQILDTNPELYFHLQQQKLIELIRMGKIEEALEFAQEELAPRGEENVSLLPQFQPVFQLVLIVSLTEEAKIQPEAIRLRCSSLHVGFGSGFLGQCLVRSDPIILLILFWAYLK